MKPNQTKQELNLAIAKQIAEYSTLTTGLTPKQKEPWLEAAVKSIIQYFLELLPEERILEGWTDTFDGQAMKNEAIGWNACVAEIRRRIEG